DDRDLRRNFAEQRVAEVVIGVGMSVYDGVELAARLGFDFLPQFFGGTIENLGINQHDSTFRLEEVGGREIGILTALIGVYRHITTQGLRGCAGPPEPFLPFRIVLPVFLFSLRSHESLPGSNDTTKGHAK